MPRKTLPRIVSVVPAGDDLTLKIRWDDGTDSIVDVSGVVNAYRVYAPLRHDLALFRQVRVGEYGADIIWTDAIDMSADTLWRLAREQSGTTMGAGAFRQWRRSRGYTLDQAAAALGLSRRTVAYYEKGERPIPRVVALATRALEVAE